MPKKPKMVVARKKKPIVQKEHPWRECPIDHHWVRPQIKHREPSKKHPDGIVPYRGFCRINPTGKSSIYPDELTHIAEKYFLELGKDIPVDSEFKKKDQFNDFIAGWTKYWNDIFKPSEPLDPALVKALIATESGFNLKVADQKAGKAGKARGILQLTDEALKILDSSDSASELKDYLIHLTHDEVKDPNLSIAAGVRWLFHKRYLAESALGHEPSWLEAVIFYKSYKNYYLKGKPIYKMKGVNDIIEAYKRITGKDLK